MANWRPGPRARLTSAFAAAGLQLGSVILRRTQGAAVALGLADVEGFSYKEIAEITDVPIGTVMSRIHRGRRALQKALHEFAEARGLVGTGPSQAG